MDFGIFTAFANRFPLLYCALCDAWALTRIRFLGRRCGLVSALSLLAEFVSLRIALMDLHPQQDQGSYTHFSRDVSPYRKFLRIHQSGFSGSYLNLPV